MKMLGKRGVGFQYVNSNGGSMKTAIAILGVCFLFSFAGCATTASTITLPDGSQGYKVNCGGTGFDWSACYEKAAKLCSKKGYVFVGKGGESYLPGAKDIANAFVAEGGGGVTTWYGLVRCNE
jgi:hypothetical protein